MLDLVGAIDLHVHSAPCRFPRLADDVEVATAAARAGMAALLLKCHHESTVARGRHTEAQVEGVRVFGGIVLNAPVGHVNPAAVEAALDLGGRAVWMPTVDAGHHGDVHGWNGLPDRPAVGGYRALDDGGRLRPEVADVLELVAAHDAILATGHLSAAEIAVLVPRARAAGVEKVVVTHPLARVPRLSPDALAELTTEGAIIELDYCSISPMWAAATIDEVVATIRGLGAEHCVLVSDTGQRHNPMPPEALRVFAQSLAERGIAAADLDLMLRVTPARLLGLP